jgi:excisionase family DNA binding protein
VKLLSPKSAGEVVDLSEREIRRAIEKGQLQAMKRRGYKGRKGSIRIREEDLEKWIQAQFQPI